MQQSSAHAQPVARKRYKQAIDIERLLHWAYQVEKVDRVTTHHSSGSGSNIASLITNGQLGVRVDNLYAVITNKVHPDADTVHDTVKRMETVGIGLVIDYAKSGLSPNWMEGETPRPVPVLRDNGKPKMEYWDGQKQRKPAYCLVAYDPEPDHIEFVRQIYRTWWDALAWLAGELTDLTSYEVTGPAAPRAPWTTKGLANRERT